MENEAVLVEQRRRLSVDGLADGEQIGSQRPSVLALVCASSDNVPIPPSRRRKVERWTAFGVHLIRNETIVISLTA